MMSRLPGRVFYLRRCPVSKFRASYSQVSVPRGGCEVVPPEFREEFPQLSEVLGGIPAAGDDEALPRHSVILFLEGGRLKFCLSNRGSQRCAFGTVEDPAKGLAGVELALAEGHYEWKNRK